MGRNPGIGEEIEGAVGALVECASVEAADVTGAAVPACKPRALPLKGDEDGGNRCSDDVGATEAANGVGRMGALDELAFVAVAGGGADIDALAADGDAAAGLAAKDSVGATDAVRFDEFVESDELPK